MKENDLKIFIFLSFFRKIPMIYGRGKLSMSAGMLQTLQ